MDVNEAVNVMDFPPETKMIGKRSVIKRFNKLALTHHPDKGGLPANFIRLSDAKDTLLNYFELNPNATINVNINENRRTSPPTMQPSQQQQPPRRQPQQQFYDDAYFERQRAQRQAEYAAQMEANRREYEEREAMRQKKLNTKSGYEYIDADLRRRRNAAANEPPPPPPQQRRPAYQQASNPMTQSQSFSSNNWNESECGERSCAIFGGVTRRGVTRRGVTRKQFKKRRTKRNSRYSRRSRHSRHSHANK